MQAQKLKKKKGTINKGKVKKTIKNVICRPDPVFWPIVTEDEGNTIETGLREHRVSIPDFKKPHWNEIKSIPKSERPKPPPIKKVDGLLFGIASCHNSIQNKNCSTMLLEATIDPQALVQTIIEACKSANIPIICIKNLRIITKSYFGIQTSCLGIEKNKLVQLYNTIKEISQKYKPSFCQSHIIENKADMDNNTNKEISFQKKGVNESNNIIVPSNLYLFRTNKKARVFVPNSQLQKEQKQFSGQQFITIAENECKTNKKAYMNMILKRMSNNANRVKLKPNKDFK